jgi:uncharacterized membrane protein YdbT with pleckstrin-like domain
MATYIESTLAPDERVIAEGRITNWIWFWPIVLAIVAFGVMLAINARWRNLILVDVLILAAIVYELSHPLIRQRTTNLVVTDRRVISKVGLISRHTQEIRLAKIESIGIDQGIAGRVLNYGAVMIRGVGGSWEPIRQIGDPLAFKRAVEGQLGVLERGESQN